MTAASFWSLLAPAIEMAEDPESYGALAFLPVAVGFVVGAAFVMAAGEQYRACVMNCCVLRGRVQFFLMFIG